MSEVVQGTPQEFWQSPSVLAPVTELISSPPLPSMAETCATCHQEFMIGARYCHACGAVRSAIGRGERNATARMSPWAESLSRLSDGATTIWRNITFPAWLRYLHFHEIQRWMGLPTASLIAFIFGLGCLAGAVGVSVFYKASNLGEFQAIQMWRIEWLLAATAAFVAGILLKKPSDPDND